MSNGGTHPGIIDLNKPGEIYPLGTKAAPWSRFMTLSQGIQPAGFFDGTVQRIAKHHGLLMNKMMNPLTRNTFTEDDERVLCMLEYPRVVWVFASLAISEVHERINALETSNRELKKQVLDLAQMVAKLAKGSSTNA